MSKFKNYLLKGTILVSSCSCFKTTERKRFSILFVPRIYEEVIQSCSKERTSHGFKTLKREIINFDHKVLRIYNIKHKNTRHSLNVFVVKLQQNKDIYSIEFLYIIKVIIKAKRLTTMHNAPKMHTKHYCI